MPIGGGWSSTNRKNSRCVAASTTSPRAQSANPTLYQLPFLLCFCHYVMVGGLSFYVSLLEYFQNLPGNLHPKIFVLQPIVGVCRSRMDSVIAVVPGRRVGACAANQLGGPGPSEARCGGVIKRRPPPGLTTRVVVHTLSDQL